MPRLSRAQLLKNLSDTSVEERLIFGLDPFTLRELAVNPPSGSETMRDIGIGPTTLDTRVRWWINRTFREPNGHRKLIKGELKPSTTWSALLELCK